MERPPRQPDQGDARTIDRTDLERIYKDDPRLAQATAVSAVRALEQVIAEIPMGAEWDEHRQALETRRTRIQAFLDEKFL